MFKKVAFTMAWLSFGSSALTADGKVEILRMAAGDGTAPTVLRTFAVFAVMSGSDEDWSIPFAAHLQVVGGSR